MAENDEVDVKMTPLWLPAGRGIDNISCSTKFSSSFENLRKKKQRARREQGRGMRCKWSVWVCLRAC